MQSRSALKFIEVGLYLRLGAVYAILCIISVSLRME